MSYSKQDTVEEVEHFEEIIKSLVELKKKKAGDYGNSWRVFGLMGIIYQIGSKFIRIWNIKNRSADLKDTNNEPLEDSFRDIANYAIMGMQLIETGQEEDAFTSFGASFGENNMDDPSFNEDVKEIEDITKE